MNAGFKPVENILGGIYDGREYLEAWCKVYRSNKTEHRRSALVFFPQLTEPVSSHHTSFATPSLHAPFPCLSSTLPTPLSSSHPSFPYPSLLSYKLPPPYFQFPYFISYCRRCRKALLRMSVRRVTPHDIVLGGRAGWRAEVRVRVRMDRP